MSTLFRYLTHSALWLSLASAAAAQASSPFEGVMPFQPLSSHDTYLLEMDGTISHTWPGTHAPGQAIYLNDAGNLVRTIKTNSFNGGAGGGIQEVADDGTTIWEFIYDDPTHLSHHDIALMPNGNILMIAWEFMTSNDAVDAGRNPNLVAGSTFAADSVIEIAPNGTGGADIVWEWRVWDHIIQDYDADKPNYGAIDQHPELINLNYPPTVPGQGDWNHINSIDYNADLDQILLSSHGQDEIWIIDHSTTTAEAAGHSGGDQGRGGDLLYRWGNPRAYRHGAPSQRKLFGQHDAQWIADGLSGAGDILLFNNGAGRPAGQFSTIDQFTPPLDASGGYSYTAGTAYGPTALSWSYTDPNPNDFYSGFISGCQRLPGGTTLVCSGGQGWFFEVDDAGTLIWEYFTSNTFKIRRYGTCDAPTTYCSTAPNSAGSGALIGSSGSTNISVGDFALSVTDAPANTPGIFYFGTGQASVPFGDGFRCATGTLSRLSVLFTDASGSGIYPLDFTDASSPAGSLSAGDTRYFQFWFRDNAFGGVGYNLSDGLSVTLCN
ncbi:MAG: aryl-sulfate sulfotransferase [Planctomycetota bacterium]|nr:aryl-sulfate sulfotransferase [Planctomycetota bacterium]MDP6837487.1 aryl-sulfate sulfotransferase [Planctomycetota bacterium]MDP6957125.1 aryl-sulfate sulfotransferase [Planctomycetota bacterium]